MSTIILLENIESCGKNGAVFSYKDKYDQQVKLNFPALVNSSVDGVIGFGSIVQENKDIMIFHANIGDSSYEFKVRDYASIKVVEFNSQLEKYLTDESYRNSRPPIPEIAIMCDEIRSFSMSLRALMLRLNVELNLGLIIDDKSKYFLTEEMFFEKTQDYIPRYALVYSKNIDAINESSFDKSVTFLKDSDSNVVNDDSFEEDAMVLSNNLNSKGFLYMGEYPQYLSIKETDNANGDVINDLMYTVHDDSLNILTMDYDSIQENLVFTHNSLQEWKAFFLSEMIATIARETISGGIDSNAISSLISNIVNHEFLSNVIDTDAAVGSSQVTSSIINAIDLTGHYVLTTDFDAYKTDTDEILGLKAPQSQVDIIESHVETIKDNLLNFESKEAVEDIRKRLVEIDKDGKPIITFDNKHGMLISINQYAKVKYVNDELAKKADQSALDLKEDKGACYLRNETYTDKQIDAMIKKLTDKIAKLATQDQIKGILDALDLMGKSIKQINKDLGNHDGRITELEKDKISLADFQVFQGVVSGHTTDITNIQSVINKLPTDTEAIKALTDFFNVQKNLSSGKYDVNAYTKTDINDNFYTSKYIEDHFEKKGSVPAGALTETSLLSLLTVSKFLKFDASAIVDISRNVYTKDEADAEFLKTAALDGYMLSSTFTNWQTSIFNGVSTNVDKNTQAISVLETQLASLNITELQDIINQLSGVDVTNFVTKDNLVTFNLLKKVSGVYSSNVYTSADADNTFVKKTELTALAGIQDWVLTSTFTPVSAQVTTNKNDIADLKQKIDALDIATLQSLINQLSGIDVTNFVTKDNLVTFNLLKKVGGVYSSNVYTSADADNTFVKKTELTALAGIQDWVLTSTFTPVSDQVTTNKNDIADINNKLNQLGALSNLSGYAKISDLVSGQFLTTGATVITNTTRNVVTKAELATAISGVSVDIDAIITAIDGRNKYALKSSVKAITDAVNAFTTAETTNITTLIGKIDGLLATPPKP